MTNLFKFWNSDHDINDRGEMSSLTKYTEKSLSNQIWMQFLESQSVSLNMNILGGVSLTINQESGKLDTQVFAEQMSLIFLGTLSFTF